MATGAAELVDHILPHVPIRQWVLSLPHALRSITLSTFRTTRGRGLELLANLFARRRCAVRAQRCGWVRWCLPKPSARGGIS
jgi:hypothetical protein